jgi:hypothetical protein
MDLQMPVLGTFSILKFVILQCYFVLLWANIFRIFVLCLYLFFSMWLVFRWTGNNEGD